MDGWFQHDAAGTGTFDDMFEDVRHRVESDGRVRLRILARASHANFNGSVHGGFLMGLIDLALFVVPVALGVERVVGGSTIGCATQFLAPVNVGWAFDIVGEIQGETEEMVFLRGTIEQDDEPKVGFSGSVRRVGSDLGAERAAAFVDRRLAVRRET
jgi:acyl-coenzyme A thioesterase PaaI-like protein